MSSQNKKSLQSLKQLKPPQQLERVVLASLLWEDQFYLDGEKHAELVQRLVQQVQPEKVAELALRAREQYKLRHVPLLLTRELARVGKLQADTLAQVIQRADEMAEFLSLYWRDGKCALSNQVKRGLATAFNKFNEYQFAKWDKNSAHIKLRDVMFLVHPKPVHPEQEELFKRIANRQLETPLTWETELSAGADKRATFTRLMLNNKLGALAFIRNLRNMAQSGVENSLILEYSRTVDVSRVLPFRFIAAARQVPQFEQMLEHMMFRALQGENQHVLHGKTAMLVDVSGSMFGTPVSKRSDLDRFDAAAALAVLCREVCEQVDVYSFSDNLELVPPRRGFSLVDALRHSQRHSGTRLDLALHSLYKAGEYNRIIVFTDEQVQGSVPNPRGLGYIVNVAAYQNGISNETWHTVNGFSEAVLQYIQALENQ